VDAEPHHERHDERGAEAVLVTSPIITPMRPPQVEQVVEVPPPTRLAAARRYVDARRDDEGDAAA